MDKIRVVDALNVVDLINMADAEPVHCQMDDYVVLKGYDCEGIDRGTRIEEMLSEASFGDPLYNLMRKEEEQGGPIALLRDSTY